MRTAFLPYCKPVLSDHEIESVVRTLRNGWLTTGPNVRELEQQLAMTSGVRHAIVLNSCTAALHVALRAMGVGPGDEVIMPSFTFVAGAQCTLELGATPVFCDIDSETLSVTAESIGERITKATKVIIPMPYAGRPLDIAAIVQLAKERNIRVLEDAAHAAGMLDRGEWAGVRSDAAAYSFYATKNLTSAEGGALLTNDDELANRARVLGLHGMDKDAWKRYTAAGSWRYDVREPGFKYNLADPLAALAIGQLQQLDAMQSRRDEIAQRYLQRLSDLPGLSCQKLSSNSGDKHSWCMFVIQVNERQTRSGIGRDALIDGLRDANIGSSVHYIPTHEFSAYRSLEVNSLPNTEAVWRRVVSLPLYPAMSDDDVDDVLDALEMLVSPNTFAFA